ncbi:Avirulence (Avh) protein [Phytophthora megakarya]|uniref:RxLR effector protein n=1 Tax=Phytophthora megakarya TaxID=4795 RepID=A0A225W6B1_9STRA|nr:Avirulence (Avh) protein [Phytophthora megakarya]
MRLVHTIALVISATLCARVAALPPINELVGAVQNAASPDVADAIYKDDGRLLRGAEKYTAGYDEIEEERTDFKKIMSKLKPVKVVENSVDKTNKIKEFLKDAAEYQKFLEKARKTINKN